MERNLKKLEKENLNLQQQLMATKETNLVLQQKVFRMQREKMANGTGVNASTLDRSEAIVVPDYQYSAHVASEDLLLWLIDNLGFVFVRTS